MATNQESAGGSGALAGVRVLDLTDERGIYGVKLLADLGADVIRPEPPNGDPLRARGPKLGSEPDTSLWHAWFASSRRFCKLDPELPDGQALLDRLVAEADIAVTCAGAFAVDAARLVEAQDARPQLVVIDVTSFGEDGPWAEFLAPDLVAGALGGAVATTGDVDTPPLKLFGEQNFMVSGAYVAIAALAGLLHQRAGGQGQRVGVSVHECIASCLEHVLMWYWYTDLLAGANSRVLPRRGSLHWSNIYQVMPAREGSIMITPAPDFETQIFWLVEEDVHEDLIDPKYQQPENLPLLIDRTMTILRQWVAGKNAEELFFAGQDRHLPYGWVLPVEELAKNPQLSARDWWHNYEIDGESVTGSGAPYQFADTPWRVLPYESAAAATIDWLPREPAPDTAPRPELAAADSKRPLEGIRVLDFTHVLAGPFATRVLADMGADVVKVNSRDRAEATNDPNHPYYLMWNRNKRGLALNMSEPGARSIARRLAEQADLVIDNFSVGVLDRWGIGYDTISEANPGVSYVQMSGMGEGGPWSKFVTYAPTIHALTGLTQVTGVPGREDIGAGFSYNDHQAGLHGAVAILAALAARARTGRGQRVDLSQFETGVNFLGPALLDWFANANPARPVANDLPYDAVAPHGVYRCADGGGGADPVENERWVAIACMTDTHWQALRGLLGSPDWSAEPGLQSAAGRVEQRRALDEHLSAWTRTQDALTVMHRCQQAGVPAGVVQSGVDLMEHDPQLRLSGFAQQTKEPHPTVGATYADRLPLRFHATPCEAYERVRLVGEDNVSVLEDWLGMDEQQVRAAEAEGQLI